MWVVMTFFAKPLQVPKLLNKLKIQLGLTWLYEGDDKAMPEKLMLHNQRQLLPIEVIETIKGHVRIGDLFGLNLYLTEFGKSYPEFQDIAEAYYAAQR